MAYLPYDGGGNYYHADVSPSMATALIEAIAAGVEVRQIHLRDTKTEWAGEPDRENDYEVLESADLEWESPGYGGKPTLAVMTPDEVEAVEREITESAQLGGYIDLGAIWSPPPPKPKRPLASLMPVSVEEVAMMRRVAAADPNGTGVCAPEKPDRTLEWLSGLGLFAKVEFEGRTAYRLTDRGRQIAAQDEGSKA